MKTLIIKLITEKKIMIEETMMISIKMGINKDLINIGLDMVSKIIIIIITNPIRIKGKINLSNVINNYQLTLFRYSNSHLFNDY